MHTPHSLYNYRAVHYYFFPFTTTLSGPPSLSNITIRGTGEQPEETGSSNVGPHPQGQDILSSIISETACTNVVVTGTNYHEKKYETNPAILLVDVSFDELQ